MSTPISRQPVTLATSVAHAPGGGGGAGGAGRRWVPTPRAPPTRGGRVRWGPGAPRGFAPGHGGSPPQGPRRPPAPGPPRPAPAATGPASRGAPRPPAGT